MTAGRKTVESGSGRRYELHECVGEGGSAKVYRGVSDSGVEVAVKVFTHDGDEAALARFEREVHVAESLRHPSLVALLDHGVDPERGPFLVMPFIKGVSARAFCGGRRLCPEAALVLALPVLDALKLMHGFGLIHRDLKPENIIVSPEGSVMLVDLGLALGVDHSRLTEQGKVAGSVPYMAPEQIEDLPLSPACDVWAMGVILHEWITGERPFASPTSTGRRLGEEVAAILRGVHEPLQVVDSRCSAELGATIDRCLDRDPSARPADAGALLDLLVRHLDWTTLDELHSDLADLTRSVEAYCSRIGERRISSLREAARTHIASGEGFAAFKLLDRALAYAPDDPETLELVELAAQADPTGATRSAVQSRAARTATAATTCAAQRGSEPTSSPPDDSWRKGLLIAGLVIAGIAIALVIAFIVAFVSCALSCRDCLSGCSNQLQDQARPQVVAAPSPPPPHESELAASLRPLQIATGLNHACAVVEGQRVYCWGDNTHGQLGTGSNEAMVRPAMVQSLSRAAAVGVGTEHSCAMTDEGRVFCWGEGRQGQLGNGMLTPSPLPVEVSALPSAKALAVGTHHSCAVIDDSSVMCWGSDLFGQCGGKGGLYQRTPFRIAELEKAIAVGVGQQHSCALVQGGKVLCWGSNAEGRLGFGGHFASSTPVEVLGISGAVSLAVGDDHSCAAIAGGAVRCWGDGRQGQLAGTESSRTPLSMPVTGPRDLVVGRGTTCVVMADGSARCWGLNEYGVLGAPGDVVREPTVMPLSQPIRRLSLGGTYTCVITEAPYALCWGALGAQLLGRGPVVSAPSPVGVAFNPPPGQMSPPVAAPVLDADTVELDGAPPP